MDSQKRQFRQDQGQCKNTRASESGTVKPPFVALETDRAAHLRELEKLRATLLELPESTIEEGDPSIAEREKTLVLIQQIENHIAEIGHALQATREGAYGICERCGLPIGRERLDVLPETRLCVKCKSQTEKSIHYHTRSEWIREVSHQCSVAVKTCSAWLFARSVLIVPVKPYHAQIVLPGMEWIAKRWFRLGGG